MNQLTLPIENLKDENKKRQVKTKRQWENAFQKWSDENFQDSYSDLGVCGYGVMCDWCEDNSYGRPCVRALNSMLREKGQLLDYSKQNFEEIWRGAE